MNEVLFGLDQVFVKLDDILISSENEIDHVNHLKCVFQILQLYGLTINVDKCVFGRNEISFLGHLVDCFGIRPLTEKV